MVCTTKKSVKTFSSSLNSPFKGLKILTWNGWKRGPEMTGTACRESRMERRNPFRLSGLSFWKELGRDHSRPSFFSVHLSSLALVFLDGIIKLGLIHFFQVFTDLFFWQCLTILTVESGAPLWLRSKLFSGAPLRLYLRGFKNHFTFSIRSY